MRIHVLIVCIACGALFSLLFLNQPEPAVAASSGANHAQQDDTADEQADDEEGSIAVFMQQKLDNSSNILRGLMTEDFPLIIDSADRLLDMSKAERWRASNDMMYLQHSQQFRNVVDELKQKAQKKSVDGASLAWVNVTMSCIQCHNWVRNILLAESATGLDGPSTSD